MAKSELSNQLFKYFNHSPTDDQVLLVNRLENFLSNGNDERVMLVKGYAGTGKTSLIAALVQVLPAIKYKSVLLAPTGRAAKVLSSYANKSAFTIHKVIYRSVQNDGKVSYELRPNNKKNTIYIVDEASMIPDGNSYEQTAWGSGKGLLEDLITYVFSGEGSKLILVGDNAQLPPVHAEESPAMDVAYLERRFHIQADAGELRQVIRQEKASGILYNATRLRNLLLNESTQFDLKLNVNGFDDVFGINGLELEDTINQAYSDFGEENTIILCRSNKRANLYNQSVRHRIKWFENDIAAGDLMMVVKNNYYWLDSKSDVGFIANGDIIEVTRISKTEEMYGFRFADVSLRMIDYPNQPEMEIKILLNSIMSESAALSTAESRQLYDAINEDYADITNKRVKYLKIKNDPYYNALQVKFAYAVTCHKSQGGQWDVVFIDQGYLTKQMLNREYIRWLYTAISRATRKLYFVNFNENFFN